jgi:hypothetical protein
MRSAIITAALAAALAAACGTTVDPDGLPSIEGYETWDKLTFFSDIPGHPDSVRDTYVNDVGRSYAHGGKYPLGTVIVKEIFEREGTATPGALRYVAIMRKVGDDADVDAPVDGGWVFTQLEGGEETSRDLCWATCHEQAPWDGAWFDYGE